MGRGNAMVAMGAVILQDSSCIITMLSAAATVAGADLDLYRADVNSLTKWGYKSSMLRYNLRRARVRLPARPACKLSLHLRGLPVANIMQGPNMPCSRRRNASGRGWHKVRDPVLR